MSALLLLSAIASLVFALCCPGFRSELAPFAGRFV